LHLVGPKHKDTNTMSADSRRQLQRVFGLLDRDHDNFLSLSELNRFMAALQLEPGTLEDFRAFCEQTGASPELGLSVGDFTAAYAETPTEKLDEIILVSSIIISFVTNLFSTYMCTRVTRSSFLKSTNV